VKPGQYFVLRIDFARGEHREDPKNAQLDLQRAIAHALEEFYVTYADYLGGDESKLIQNIEVGCPSDSLVKCLKVVNRALKADQNRSDKQLANVKGVRMNGSLILLG